MRSIAYRLLTPRAIRGTTRRVGHALLNTGRLRFKNDPNYNGELSLQTDALGLVQKGSADIWVIDVGADVGAWSLSMVEQAGRLGLTERLRLVAVEPVEASFVQLRRNLRRTGLPNLELQHLAISDVAGTSIMNVYGPTAVTNSLEPPPPEDSIAPIALEEVSTVSLPELISELGLDGILMIKIDTEGHDFRVLRGAVELFRTEAVRICQFEYNRRWIAGRHFLLDVFELLDGLPYDLGYITPRGIAWTPSWHSSLEDWYESNYVIVHNQVSPLLPAA